MPVVPMYTVIERLGDRIKGDQPGGVRLTPPVEESLKAALARQTVTIRLIQRVLLGPEYAPGNAHWRNLKIGVATGDRHAR